MSWKFNSVSSKCMGHQSFENTIEYNCSTKDDEVNKNITHADDINEEIVARSSNNVNVDKLLGK
jgi:hypothetical protein